MNLGIGMGRLKGVDNKGTMMKLSNEII